jgi:hypothetical protein
MAELSLWLDYYDDIYSDFDSRHYGKRRISDDFLYELRNALKYREKRINDLILLLPGDKRNEPDEKMIAASLKDFFSSRYGNSANRCRRKLNRGIILGITGIIIMITNTFAGYNGAHTFPLVAIRVILEPAGWFLLWASFDFLFYNWQELKKERDFFKELAEMNIHFKSS